LKWSEGQLNKLTIWLYINFVLLILGGCGGNANEEATTYASKDSSALESKKEKTTGTDKSTQGDGIEEEDTNDVKEDTSSDESVQNPSDSNSSTDHDVNVDNDPLAQYSSEQIEYARVWLQLGPNQDIDGLYVQHIPAGTPLNPDDETSASYPEDVIQLAGSRLVDGSVTYSGNGDGTINVYNVPLRWDGVYPAGVEFYTDMIRNTELVPVDPGDDEAVIRLIKLLKEN
jgi:hypothetical protein